MVNVTITNVSPDALIKRDGQDAARVINILIGHAIANGSSDEALELNRVRRDIKVGLVASCNAMPFDPLMVKIF